jgi:hypothetical protein
MDITRVYEARVLGSTPSLEACPSAADLPPAIRRLTFRGDVAVVMSQRSGGAHTPTTPGAAPGPATTTPVLCGFLTA